MSLNSNQEKKCADCNRLITFKDFCSVNPSISYQRAEKFWEDSLFLIYCPECYFNRPERPFKLKRGYFNYYSRIKR